MRRGEGTTNRVYIVSNRKITKNLWVLHAEQLVPSSPPGYSTDQIFMVVDIPDNNETDNDMSYYDEHPELVLYGEVYACSGHFTYGAAMESDAIIRRLEQCIQQFV